MSITITPTIDSGLLEAFEQRLTPPKFEKIGRYAKHFSENLSARAGEIAETDGAERALRPLFGKGALQPPCIGDHPDFVHLKGTDETCYCPITTMFMDIEGSTRLSLLYPLEDVRRIKNAFIQTAIQIVRCFDGHVHRIMGDAVMAYFGGVTTSVEAGIIDGINCAAVLQHFAENVVRPKLDDMGYKHDFGVRIGLDHGPEDKVLWSSYGYPGIDEVTATSFFVDIAAKLQQAARRNRTMLGQSIFSTVDFPEELLLVKQVTRNGESVPVPVVEPNHTDVNGNAVNYGQRELKALEYLRCTPVARSASITTGRAKPLQVQCFVYDDEKTTCEGEYHAASRAVPKKRQLKFIVKLPYQPMLPYTIRYTVDNHGTEACTANPVNGDRHVTEDEIRTHEQHRNLLHWEHTKYRGLHYLTVEVETHRGTEFRTRFGVYVE